MAEEKEAAFPITSFAGINRNVDREQIGPNQFYQLKNLWEQKLGTLETRGASVYIRRYFPTGAGTDVSPIVIGEMHKIYKSVGNNARIVPVTKLNRTAGTTSSPPAYLSVSFVTDAAGFWNNTRTYSATDFNFTATHIIVREVGHSFDRYFRLAVSGITGYSALTNQKLRISLTGAPASGVTGLEILAMVHNGTTVTPTAVSNGSAYSYRTLWVGFIDINGLTSSTTDFLYAPYGYSTGRTTPSTSGSAKMAYIATGLNTSGGTLVAGKTYYVAVLPQYMKFSTDPRGSYRASGANTDTGDVSTVVIPGGSNLTGTIVISSMTPSETTFLVCIGEHPNLLQPYAIYNDNASTVTTVTITSQPVGNPAVINIDRKRGTLDSTGNACTPSSATSADLSFNFSNFSKYDNLINLGNEAYPASIYPVFAANMDPLKGGTWDTWYDQFGWGGIADTAPGNHQYIYYILNSTNNTSLGSSGIFRFAPYKNYALFVVGQNIGTDPHTKVQNYYITDGIVAAPVVMDFQSQVQASYRALPNAKYIGVFQDSIIIGGGFPLADPATGLGISSARTFYFSRSGNPFDFTIPGYASPTLNYINVDAGEDINGIGTLSVTSSQIGSVQKLLITNQNGLWAMDDLPTFDGAGVITNLASLNLQMLSRKIGSANQSTVAYTPIGTIVTSRLGVFILRDTGEPSPIGLSLVDLLRNADLNAATACFHDGHYKLSFYHPDYDLSGTPENVRILFPTINNCEFWLNINKVMATRGQEDWVGPMIGYGVQASLVEDRAGDGSYAAARSRYCLGTESGLGIIFKADVVPAITDSQILDYTGTAVSATVETADLKISQQDQTWNKLLKRWYWSIKTIKTSFSPLTYSDVTSVDGIQVETQSLTAYGSGTHTWPDESFTLNRVFPTARRRGRTFRKVFITAYRIAINGFQINYEVEKRRI